MRYVPPALQAHLDGDVTTTCRLLRIDLQDGRTLGMASLDKDVFYNGVLYRSVTGIDNSVIATDAGLSVDNAESFSLVADDEIEGITVRSAVAGDLDDATWSLYLVNYRDLTMGHVLLDSGDTGRVTVENEMSVTVELVSFAMRLRQTIGTLDSRTCRATFGNPLEGQYGCGYDAESLWINATVTIVDAEEPNRFFDSTATGITPIPVPGRIQWITGNNSTRNRLYQIETYTDGTIALLEDTPYPIEVGDEFRIRQDCDKVHTTCKSRYNNLLNFKGEPYIPVGDGVE